MYLHTVISLRTLETGALSKGSSMNRNFPPKLFQAIAEETSAHWTQHSALTPESRLTPC